MAEKETMKYRLAEAVKALMETESLDKITVRDIVTAAQTTRQSFYRHFQDKYDLVNWYFERLAEKSFKLMGVQYTLREGLLKKFEFIQQEKTFFSQALRSQDYNSLMRYDYQCILDFYTDWIERKTRRPLTPQIQFLLEMYCEGSMQMTVKWVTQGAKESPETIVDLLIDAQPEKLRAVLRDTELE